jgi:hypothetical protein
MKIEDIPQSALIQLDDPNEIIFEDRPHYIENPPIEEYSWPKRLPKVTVDKLSKIYEFEEKSKTGED